MNLVGVITDASQLSILFSKGFTGRGVSSMLHDSRLTQSYVYIFADGLLKPVALQADFVNSLLGGQTIIYNNKLNKAVYGVKGEDVHLDKIDAAKQIPPEVTAFRDAVNATYPVKK